MKTKKSMKLVITGLIGCGVCCLTLFFPLATGFLGLSILGFSFSGVLCGVFFLSLSVALYGIYLTKRKNVCVVHSSE